MDWGLERVVVNSFLESFQAATWEIGDPHCHGKCLQLNTLTVEYELMTHEVG